MVVGAEMESQYCQHVMTSTTSTSVQKSDSDTCMGMQSKSPCHICCINVDRDNFKLHMMIHKEEIPFECPDCAELFEELEDFIDHMEDHDINRQLLESSQHTSNDHKELISIQHCMEQIEENPLFFCKVCDKSFSQKTRLQKHIKIHKSEKNHQCDFCGRKFQFLSNLKVHLRTHSGERPFKCEQCKKMFSRSSNLSEHMKTHTDQRIKCEVCGKDLANLSAYSAHRRIHTDQKPYECSTCGKHFRQMIHLKKHRVVHTGEKKFSCPDCGKSFGRKDVLKVHQKKHETN